MYFIGTKNWTAYASVAGFGHPCSKRLVCLWCNRKLVNTLFFFWIFRDWPFHFAFVPFPDWGIMYKLGAVFQCLLIKLSTSWPLNSYLFIYIYLSIYLSIVWKGAAFPLPRSCSPWAVTAGPLLGRDLSHVGLVWRRVNKAFSVQVVWLLTT